MTTNIKILCFRHYTTIHNNKSHLTQEMIVRYAPQKSHRFNNSDDFFLITFLISTTVFSLNKYKLLLQS